MQNTLFGSKIESNKYVINLDDKLFKNPMRIAILRSAFDASKGKVIIVNTSGKEIPSDIQAVIDEFKGRIETNSEKKFV